MGKFIDMTGQRYGKLTILSRDTSRGPGEAYWTCQCDCGTIKSIRGCDIRSGKTSSCGCGIAEAAKRHKKELTGQKFGRLLVLGDSGERAPGSRVLWKCQCDCGNISNVLTYQLTSGKTQSCGCLQKERTSEASCKDLTNQRFGKLVAIEPTDNRKDGRVVWKCQCDCGNIHYTSSHELLMGGVSSCGCLGQSKGEYAVEALLKAHNIPYTREQKFKTCIFNDTQKPARFDFYINDTYLIEYDGEQHFKASSFGWDTIDRFAITQAHDEFKNNWCKENNISLIRIPYTHLDNLCIDDLLLETSHFIVK